MTSVPQAPEKAKRVREHSLTMGDIIAYLIAWRHEADAHNFFAW